MTAEPAEGTITPDQLAQEDPAYVEPELEQKSIEEVAKEVIAGYWGKGNDRKKRLQEAGYDVAAVNEEISKIYNQ